MNNNPEPTGWSLLGDDGRELDDAMRRIKALLP